LAGVVAHDGDFDEGRNVLLLFGGELVDGFELESSTIDSGAGGCRFGADRASASIHAALRRIRRYGDRADHERDRCRPLRPAPEQPGEESFDVVA
jgi:hypothetical protein